MVDAFRRLVSRVRADKAARPALTPLPAVQGAAGSGYSSSSSSRSRKTVRWFRTVTRWYTGAAASFIQVVRV